MGIAEGWPSALPAGPGDAVLEAQALKSNAAAKAR
jgi:hypothetical protein